MASGAFAGVEIAASVNGVPLGDDALAPFWAAAEATGALVFIHPTTRGSSGAGFDDYYLWNLVGNPMETTVAAAHLVLSGVMERHPDLRVLLAHGGGAVLALRGRLRHGWANLAAARDAAGRAAGGVAAPVPLRHGRVRPGRAAELVAFAGADRVLLGSDYPFDMADARPADTVAPPASTPRPSGDPRRQRRAAARTGGAADDDDRRRRRGRGGPQQPDHRRVPRRRRATRCVVLDARAIPGGGAASEELLLPGYRIDSCSTGHTLIQTNPLLLDDELGLQADYGLEYLVPDPFAHVAFPDGRHLTMWMDVERICEEIARFSQRRRRRPTAARWPSTTRSRASSAAATFTPPGLRAVARRSAWPSTRAAAIWQRRRLMSAWDVIRHDYESDHVRSFMLWQAFQTLVPIDMPGSGQLASSIVFGRQRRSWTLPRGGLGRADRRARALHRGPRRGGPVRPAGRPARPRGRPLRRRRDRGRRALPRARGGRLDHPRQAPARHGAGRRAGPRTSATASRRSTSASPASPSTTRRPRRRCSRPRTARAARCRPGSPAGRRRSSTTSARCATTATPTTSRGCSSPRRRSPTRRARPRAGTR